MIFVPTSSIGVRLIAELSAQLFNPSHKIRLTPFKTAIKKKGYSFTGKHMHCLAMLSRNAHVSVHLGTPNST